MKPFSQHFLRISAYTCVPNDPIHLFLFNHTVSIILCKMYESRSLFLCNFRLSTCFFIFVLSALCWHGELSVPVFFLRLRN